MVAADNQVYKSDGRTAIDDSLSISRFRCSWQCSTSYKLGKIVHCAYVYVRMPRVVATDSAMLSALHSLNSRLRALR